MLVAHSTTWRPWFRIRHSERFGPTPCTVKRDRASASTSTLEDPFLSVIGSDTMDIHGEYEEDAVVCSPSPKERQRRRAESIQKSKEKLDRVVDAEKKFETRMFLSCCIACT